MKKIIALISTIALCVSVTGCSGRNARSRTSLSSPVSPSGAGSEDPVGGNGGYELGK